MLQHLDAALSEEIRETVGHLPKYEGDPTGNAIDYTDSEVAYAVNVTLIHGDMEWHPSGLYLPTPQTKALVVQRASGDGEIDSESGVSGYIDVLHDPKKMLTDEAFDPVAYAARAEPNEECGIPWETMLTISFHLGAVVRTGINLGLGQRFEEPRFSGYGRICVAPILGVCVTQEPPEIHIKEDELSGYAWVPLEEIPSRHQLSPGYLETTLPNALGSIGLRPQAIDNLLYPNQP